MQIFVRNLSVGVRTAAAFGIVCLALVVVSIVSIRSLGGLNAETETIVNRDGAGLAHLVVLDGNVEHAAHLVVRHLYVFDGDLATQDEVAAQLHGVAVESKGELAKLRPLAESPGAKDAFRNFAAALTAYDAAAARAVSLSRAETVAKAEERDGSRGFYTDTFMNDHATVGKALSALETSIRSQADHQAQKASGAASSGRWVVVVAALLSILAAVAFAWFIVRSITRPLAVVRDRLKSLEDADAASLREALVAMADGDLTRSVTAVTPPTGVESGDEIGQTAASVDAVRAATAASMEAYNAMRDKLQGLIGRVTSSSAQLAAASQQMASTSEEAGKAVGEIANAVGDVAAGAERQVRMVDEATQSSDETARAAAEARATTVDGVAAAAKATDAMEQVRVSVGSVTDAIRALGAKSEEIGGIVETITGIAGQTNLLALNAAIEAARAGERGRGFAVVADEVRKLAEESQQAAESISELVAEIQGETQRTVAAVEEGSRLTADGAAVVEQTREAFEQIGQAVEAMTGRVNEVAAAMSEVASVAEQSSASTEEVSASTEQTSASTQEIAASAQQLARTADELEQLVASFRLSA